MEDWRDDYIKNATDMLYVLVKEHNLTSGNIDDDDYTALCQIISRYIENNKTPSN